LWLKSNVIPESLRHTCLSRSNVAFGDMTKQCPVR
jgi:hypothetical protein